MKTANFKIVPLTGLVWNYRITSIILKQSIKLKTALFGSKPYELIGFICFDSELRILSNLHIFEYQGITPPHQLPNTQGIRKDTICVCGFYTDDLAIQPVLSS